MTWSVEDALRFYASGDNWMRRGRSDWSMDVPDDWDGPWRPAKDALAAAPRVLPEEAGLLEELMAWYEEEPTGPRWSLIGRAIRVLILRGVGDDTHPPFTPA